MALPRISPRNQTQRIAEQSLKGNENTIGTTVITLYTVPTNKKARIVAASVRFISGGANTNLRLNMGGERMSNRTSADPEQVDLPQCLNKELDAGDTITLSGDSGSDNGSMNFFITFVELPA